MIKGFGKNCHNKSCVLLEDLLPHKISRLRNVTPISDVHAISMLTLPMTYLQKGKALHVLN
jgi:hypothetical protein